MISMQHIKEHAVKFEELCHVYCLISVNRVMKTRRMGWVGHVSHMGEVRNMYEI
jgi:hypothetical protein